MHSASVVIKLRVMKDVRSGQWMNVPRFLRKVQPAVIECRLIAAVNAIVHSAPKRAKLESVGRTSGPSHFGRRTTSLGLQASSFSA